MRAAEFDLVVFGASGFTGRLVAEYLQSHAPPDLRWALAGRTKSKLAEVRQRIGAVGSLPLIKADAADPSSLTELARRSRVVITTVGPYQKYGEPLLQACAEQGCDYVDLCGEPAWMAQMIQRHQAAAQASGARIVFSCGFDSVPFDMGVFYLQEAARQRFGQPLQRVQGQVLVMKGGFSGGTAASLIATLQAVAKDKAVAQSMADPFALTPGFTGPPQPDNLQAQYEAEADCWSAPFVMAPINTKNVHRSNLLLGHAWGTNFVYEERQLMGELGSGNAGELRARGAARTALWQSKALAFAPSRALIQRFVLPKPGEGPNAAERESGRYVLRFAGTTADGQSLSATVKGDRDPGYGSTSKIISECAQCLLGEVSTEVKPGGIWTPAAALGKRLLARLQRKAGLSFELNA